MTELVFDQYRTRLVRTNRTPHTIAIYDSIVRVFKRWLSEEGLRVEDLNPYLVEEYLDRYRSPATRRLHLMYLRAAFRYARKRGLKVEDPTEGIEAPQIPDTLPRIIPNEELRAIRDRVVTSQDELLFGLLAYTGMRREEIRTLTWEQVDLEHGSIAVIGKGRKLRSVPIHPALGEILSRHRKPNGPILISRKGGSLSTVGIHRRVSILTRGLYGAHDFRRTVATSLYVNGVPESVIDQIMGWAPKGVGRRRYLHVAGPSLQSAILKLYEDDPL